ncbi:M23 family metallopeptidase, partial [Oceanobacillus caeni]
QAAAAAKAKEIAESEKGKLEQAAREQEEKARKEAEAAAAAKKQASENNNTSSSSSDSKSSSTSSPSQSTQEVTTQSDGGNGTFSWPTSGTISSTYGHRWGKLHRGIDFAVSVGTPVKAAAPGVVIQTNTEHGPGMNGYGNVILIAHSINGETYTTLYAHLSSMAVSSGDVVSAGQVIGNSGNTGHSTGPHLHFEIHKGGWNGDANAKDPMNYLP